MTSAIAVSDWLAKRSESSSSPAPAAMAEPSFRRGIRVERSLAWMSRYRRLNTIFERTEGHLVAFIEIAFISILSRRLGRLVTQQISA